MRARPGHSTSPRWTQRILFPCFLLALAGTAFFAADRSALYGFAGCALAAGGLLAALWRWTTVTAREVLAWAVIFRLAFFWLPPGLSDDAYRYVWDGLLQANGINPYRYVPQDEALAAWHDEPVFPALNSAGYYSVYPPLSQLIFRVGAFGYAGGWEASYYLIKGLLALMELLALLVLSRMAPPRALMLYAWHPLVIVEAAGQAHTEAALVLFLVLTVRLAGRGRGGWASVALACAGWVKLYPFVLFPFLWRRFGWRAVWPAGLVSVLLVLPYAIPEAVPNVRASLALYVRYFEFNAGFYYALKKGLLVLTGADWSKQLGPALQLLFLASLPVLYAADRRSRWPLRRAFVWTLGAFLVLSTTVHPWYLLGLLALVAPVRPPAWHWYGLALASLGTYLLYAGGPYWTFVNLGWGAWAVLAFLRYEDRGLQWVQRVRGAHKFEAIRDFVPAAPGLRVLDLGAGEGYVGAALRARTGAEVVLADVVPMNRTRLPFVRYDGRRLPFERDAFDLVVLYFVLHHTEDQEQVFREALRVARRGVIVVESVYEGPRDLRVLTFLDRLANRWRSAGRMRAQEEHLHFRTVEGWRAFFREAGARIEQERRRGRFVHRQALFLLTRAKHPLLHNSKPNENAESGETR